jgi:hypothetical protein
MCWYNLTQHSKSEQVIYENDMEFKTNQHLFLKEVIYENEVEFKTD